MTISDFFDTSQQKHKRYKLTLHFPPVSLEMSTLLRATNNLETTRVQIYKDVISSLLSGLGSRGQASIQAQQRLLSVLHGQLLGMEGRLKEERGARMATLAGQCNLETREEMEAEHRREAAEKAQAELLCQHADQQVMTALVFVLDFLTKNENTIILKWQQKYVLTSKTFDKQRLVNILAPQESCWFITVITYHHSSLKPFL